MAIDGKSQIKDNHPARYNAARPALEDGQGASFQVDSEGRLITAVNAEGKYNETPPTYTDGDEVVSQYDANGNLKVTLAKQLAGEDLSADVMKVEHRYSGSRLTADGLVKTGAGFLHTLTFAGSDSAPTAGSIIVYDSTTETGTILYSETFDTTIFRGYSVILDVAFSTGLYVGFTTTTDVGVTVSYR